MTRQNEADQNEVDQNGATLPGRVTAAIYRGAHTAYTIALDAGPVITVTQTEAQAVIVGARVACTIPPGALVPLEV